jgi:hypothetical protein
VNYTAEGIAAALFSLLQTVPGLAYSSRILRTIGETPAEDMPALYMTMGDHVPVNYQSGLNTGWKYEYIIYCYLHNADAQAVPPVAGSTVLNTFLEAVKGVLQPLIPPGPAAGMTGVQVLGDTFGRVRHAWISGPVWASEGDLGEGLYLIFPIEVEVA